MDLANIWLIDQAEHPEEKHYAPFLTDLELQKAGNYRFAVDRKRFIISRAILRLILSEKAAIPPKKVPLIFGDFGKPMLDKEAGLYFNVSHSERAIVIILSHEREVGIDIEKINDAHNLWEIAKVVFSAREIEFLKARTPTDLPEAFYDLWTRKEAFIKCTGYGLSMPLDLRKVTVLDAEVAIDPEENTESSFKGYHIRSFASLPGYKAAVSARHQIPDLTLAKWPGQNFKERFSTD